MATGILGASSLSSAEGHACGEAELSNGQESEKAFPEACISLMAGDKQKPSKQGAWEGKQMQGKY